ncbi:histidine triad domain protein [Leptospira ryugenii]|uniref:Histidine triad domain protein n=1 Tax=Leptospira ryugenii TaxID=1917863 RepID=A0A2P2DXD9_9LEPT|nr:HIT domain-containing protein [Leptospira ryugenii]GBF49301.1 histidine triad domain protein [Leptospira ryugenii]
MLNCPICESIRNREAVVQESEFWLVRKAPAQKGLDGYLYLECKRHVESWFELTPEEWADFGKGMELGVSQIASEDVRPDKLYLAAIAEKVPHLHIHIVPRYESNEKGIPHLDKALGTGFLPSP